MPENALKFAVGVMLTGFGTFWAGEGVGIGWPAGDAAILALLAGYAALALVGVYLVQGRLTTGPASRTRSGSTEMRYVRAFFGFWYDFLVGDRPELFAGPISALLVAWLAVRAGVPAPLTGVLLFVLVATVGCSSVVWAMRERPGGPG